MDQKDISKGTGCLQRNPSSDLAEDRRKLKTTEWAVGIFGIALVLLSMAGYYINTTCKEISGLVSQQNEAATKIGMTLDYYASNKDTANLTTPPGFRQELVEFSRRNAMLIYTISRISSSNCDNKGEARGHPMLEQLACLRSTDGTDYRFTHGFTLNPDFHTVEQLMVEGVYQIRLYQTIRDSAQDTSTKWPGWIAVGTVYLLPILYAVLGAFVFTFRSWCNEHRREHSEHRQHSHPYWPDRTSRLLIAGIAGIAVGALSELFPKEVLLSPLALAFIIGYSIEVFISRLDSVIQKLKKPEAQIPMHTQHTG